MGCREVYIYGMPSTPATGERSRLLLSTSLSTHLASTTRYPQDTIMTLSEKRGSTDAEKPVNPYRTLHETEISSKSSPSSPEFSNSPTNTDPTPSRKKNAIPNTAPTNTPRKTPARASEAQTSIPATHTPPDLLPHNRAAKQPPPYTLSPHITTPELLPQTLIPSQPQKKNTSGFVLSNSTHGQT